MSQPHALSVLIIEDDADTRANLTDILELDGYDVHVAGTAAEALYRQNWSELCAIILDSKLPDSSAEVLLPQLRLLAPAAAVMIVTGYGDLQGAIAALRQGAADYILKPIDTELLRKRLARIAEHWQVKEALGRSEATMGALLETAPCLILILRGDHVILYISPFAEQLTGYTARELLGKETLLQFIPSAESRQTVARELNLTLQGTPTQGFESPIRRKDGSLLSLVWNAQRLANYQGQPAILAVGQDITPLKQAQEKTLQSARLAAIGQMVTGLAHESRNALQRSQACLEMLALEVADRPPALNLLDRIQKAQDHLHHLYEEVRGFAAPVRLNSQRAHVGRILEETWDHLTLTRQGRDARLLFAETDLDLHCLVDPLALEQVFRNVLENSLSAGRDPVRIDISWAECRLGRQPALQISLADNGPGLSAEQRARIFEPFYTTKTQGTGLGMAIAKRIVEAHGGKLSLGSADRPGAEILVTLPRNLP